MKNTSINRTYNEDKAVIGRASVVKHSCFKDMSGNKKQKVVDRLRDVVGMESVRFYLNNEFDVITMSLIEDECPEAVYCCIPAGRNRVETVFTPYSEGCFRELIGKLSV